MENKNNREMDIVNSRIPSNEEKHYVYKYMRTRPNMHIEKLYEKNNMQFQRKTWNMMHPKV